MELRHLHYLLVIERHRSLSAAAAEIGISQPALTKAVKHLEALLRAPVLERGARGVRLNRFGEALARRARIVDIEVRSALREVEAMRNARSGDVAIGVGPSFEQGAVPEAVAAILAERPTARVRVVGALNGDLLPRLASGELDMVFGTLPGLPEGDLRQRTLLHDPLLVVSGTHGRAKRTWTLPDLATRPWALFGPTDFVRLHFEGLFRRAGLDVPAVAVESQTAPFVKALVMGSDHLSLFPRRAVAAELAAGQLRALNVPDGTASVELGVVVRAAGTLSPLAEEVLARITASVRRSQKPRGGGIEA